MNTPPFMTVPLLGKERKEEIGKFITGTVAVPSTYRTTDPYATFNPLCLMARLLGKGVMVKFIIGTASAPFK